MQIICEKQLKETYLGQLRSKTFLARVQFVVGYYSHFSSEEQFVVVFILDESRCLLPGEEKKKMKQTRMQN